MQHHANDIFTDVVDIAFHGGDHHLAVGFTLLFAGFNKRFEIRHCLFHDARRFDHLWQEHFPFAKQIADHVHTVHQRAFNHFNRARSLLAGFFGILLDKLGNAFNQRVFQTFIHFPRAPLRLLGVSGVVGFAAAIFLGKLQ